MSQLEPIELQVLLNSTAVAHQSNQLRASLRGVDTSIASTEKKFGDLTRSQMQALRVQMDYQDLFAEFSKKPNLVYLLDPPYLSTDTKTYYNMDYWRL